MYCHNLCSEWAIVIEPVGVCVALCCCVLLVYAWNVKYSNLYTPCAVVYIQYKLVTSLLCLYCSLAGCACTCTVVCFVAHGVICMH